MSIALPSPSVPEIEYPDTDGEPIAENTLQFHWIKTIQGNVDRLFAHDPMVLVAGDLLWYPVEGDPKIRIAPDPPHRVGFAATVVSARFCLLMGGSVPG